MIYPLLIRNAVPQSFIDHVIKLTNENIDSFTANKAGPNRKFLRDPYKVYSDPVIAKMKEELANRFDMKDWVLDPYFMDVIGYITEGGYVHTHLDQDIDDHKHMRINVLIQKPVSGGLLVLDGEELEVGVGDVWLNLASLCVHSCTAIAGNKPRSILSLGYQVANDAAEGIIEKYRTWEKSL
jgi:hypothetical protein